MAKVMERSSGNDLYLFDATGYGAAVSVARYRILDEGNGLSPTYNVSIRTSPSPFPLMLLTLPAGLTITRREHLETIPG